MTLRHERLTSSHIRRGAKIVTKTIIDMSSPDRGAAPDIPVVLVILYGVVLLELSVVNICAVLPILLAVVITCGSLLAGRNVVSSSVLGSPVLTLGVVNPSALVLIWS